MLCRLYSRALSRSTLGPLAALQDTLTLLLPSCCDLMSIFPFTAFLLNGCFPMSLFFAS